MNTINREIEKQNQIISNAAVDETEAVAGAKEILEQLKKDKEILNEKVKDISLCFEKIKDFSLRTKYNVDLLKILNINRQI